MKTRILFIAVLSALSACTRVDDYLLGKDNTSQPEKLKPIHAQVKLSKNWSVAVEGAEKNATYSKLKPTVHNNIVYSASAQGLVKAVQIGSAATLWSKTLPQGISAGPYVAEGLVALGAQDSKVALLRATDGTILWQKPVAGQIFSMPLIVKNKVIVKTLDGKIYAFATADGKQLWLVDHGAPALVLKASSSPVVVANLLLAGFSDGRLDAIDLENGRVVWQKSIAFASGASDVERLVDIDADPIIRNNIAYLASYQGYVGAMSLVSGEFIWKKPASVYKNMILAAHTLYFTDSEDLIWALDSRTGSVLWKQAVLKARGLTEPVLLGGHLVVGDKTGVLHVISTETGELLGREQLAGAIMVTPVVANKKLIVQTANGQLNELSVG